MSGRVGPDDPRDGPRRPLDRLPTAQRPWVVLIVDDEPDMLHALSDLVEGFLEHVVVLRARSARQAVELLERERVDLIVSDFKMPGMDGIELLHMAKLGHPGVPRVMITAYDEQLVHDRAAAEAAVAAFVSKASDPHVFLQRIVTLLQYNPAITPAP